METKGGVGVGEMNWEIGINIYTLLYIEQVTNENLLYSTGNPTQCYVVTKMERKIQKRRNICILINDSICFTEESNTL